MKLQVILVTVFAIGLGLYASRDQPLVKQALQDFNDKITLPMGIDLNEIDLLPHCASPYKPSLQSGVLRYFAGRGRAEAIRMLMIDTKLPYTEVKYTRETWPAAKQQGLGNGSFTFGQVPSFTTHDGKDLVQTYAIMKYIARAKGAACPDELEYRCDLISMGAEDLRKRASKVMYDTDFSATSRQGLFTTDVPTWLAHFEKLLGDDATFVTPDTITWVDYVMFDLLDMLRSFASEPVYAADGSQASISASSILKPFPKLAAFYDTMGKRPLLRAYLTSSERPAFKLPYPPAKPEPVAEVETADKE
eukprot:TRINITY_DN8688_c0_g1_i3.p1 TRINITY_DN8688_c0_g1~~TRINITY_DN8688_c0_g1_i3.p1  ORF type:complete len:305 (+),score=77.38 TRINITY_DN8688_c0_g1_i3:21-935(+)